MDHPSYQLALAPTGLDHSTLQNYACDIRQGMLPNQTFDAVVHLAALAGVRPSMDRKLDWSLR